MADETSPLLHGSAVGINTPPEDQREFNNGCSSFSLCDPKKSAHRYMVLVFMCFLGFGSYFCYDNPAALQNQIISDMDVSTSQYSSLYSWYSWPNVILCFFGGFLIDRVFGIRCGAIIYSVFILFGQLVFSLGALFNRFWVMDLGRFIFGVGGESLAVAQNTYAVRWFKEKELNMVFGLQLSFARVGSSVNFWVMISIYNWINGYFSGYKCLGIVLSIASLTCLLSLICALVLGYFDRRAEKVLQNLSNDTEEVIRIKDVKYFPLTFWMMSIICIAYYVAVFIFIGLGTVFFSRKYAFSQHEANSVDSIVYIISAVASPVLGFMVDKLGYNLSWVLISVIITLGSHMLLAFTFLNPWIAMVIMGIGYSLLACALWPMVAIEIPEHQLGTAYGIMQSIQNLGLAVIALCAGYIVDKKGYLFLEVFFLDCICVSLIATIVLFFINTKKGGQLNLSVAERTSREEEQLTADALERERFLTSASMSDVTPHDLLWTHSDFSIRNRFLSRIGAKLPSHYNIGLRALIHRTGLK